MNLLSRQDHYARHTAISKASAKVRPRPMQEQQHLCMLCESTPSVAYVSDVLQVELPSGHTKTSVRHRYIYKLDVPEPNLCLADEVGV